jgi:glycosyltransferase involved in cell wall biosynthesis
MLSQELLLPLLYLSVFSHSISFFLTLCSIIPRRIKLKSEPNTKIAVIIPAHNEEKNIEKNLPRIIANIDYPEKLFQVIVIADNCDDSTSYLASFQGARVIERTNDWKKGKGHALEWAFQKLQKEDFDLFLILDADTYIEKNALRYLDAEFSEGHIAMQLPLKPEITEERWEIALTNAFNASKIYLQPKGRDRIGFSSPLFGNASCFAKEMLDKFPFEAGKGNNVLEYSLKLIFAGEKARFICGKETSAYVEKPIRKIIKYYPDSLSGKYARRLIKESLKFNFTACESLLNILSPTIDIIIIALFVILFSGITLCFSAALPECQPLVKFGLVLSAISVLSLLLIPFYILIGMLQNRVSLKSWTALLISPVIAVSILFQRFRDIFRKPDTKKAL